MIGGKALATKSQRTATSRHRRRSAARGLMRVEVQAAKGDVGLIRALAHALCSEPQKAQSLRATLEKELVESEIRTAFDVFGSDLPDEAFAGIFDQPRQREWREFEL